MAIKQSKAQKAPKKQYIHGFCDPECEFYKIKDSVSFNGDGHKATVELCCWGDCCRSFGCLGACPLGNVAY